MTYQWEQNYRNTFNCEIDRILARALFDLICLQEDTIFELEEITYGNHCSNRWRNDANLRQSQANYNFIITEKQYGSNVNFEVLRGLFGP